MASNDQRPLALGLPPSSTQGGRSAVQSNVLRFVLRPRNDTPALAKMRAEIAKRLCVR